MHLSEKGCILGIRHVVSSKAQGTVKVRKFKRSSKSKFNSIISIPHLQPRLRISADPTDPTTTRWQRTRSWTGKLWPWLAWSSPMMSESISHFARRWRGFRCPIWRPKRWRSAKGANRKKFQLLWPSASRLPLEDTAIAEYLRDPKRRRAGIWNIFRARTSFCQNGSAYVLFLSLGGDMSFPAWEILSLINLEKKSKYLVSPNTLIQRRLMHWRHKITSCFPTVLKNYKAPGIF